MYISTSIGFNGPITIGIVLVIIVGELGMRIEMFHLCRSLQMAATCCRMRCRKTLALHTCIRFEYHEHFIRRCRYRMWCFGAAEFAKCIAVNRVAVEDLYIIVGTLLVRFNLERKEMQTYTMAGRRGKVPDTVFFPRIVVGVVGTLNGTVRCGNLVFASALFAVKTVFVQYITVVTRTHIWPDGVLTFVHTSTIINSTFVNICKGNRIKEWVLARSSWFYSFSTREHLIFVYGTLLFI